MYVCLSVCLCVYYTSISMYVRMYVTYTHNSGLFGLKKWNNRFFAIQFYWDKSQNIPTNQWQGFNVKIICLLLRKKIVWVVPCYDMTIETYDHASKNSAKNQIMIVVTF